MLNLLRAYSKSGDEEEEERQEEAGRTATTEEAAAMSSKAEYGESVDRNLCLAKGS